MNTNFFLTIQNKELFDLIEHKFNEIKEILNEIKSSNTTSDADPVFLDGIEDACNAQLKKVARIQQKIIQGTCKHKIIEDLIDITPDKSVIIKYCEFCEFCVN